MVRPGNPFAAIAAPPREAARSWFRDRAQTMGISSAYGAAASLIVVLLWVYYSAQIVLFSAEFTWVFAHRYGSRRGPTPP